MPKKTNPPKTKVVPSPAALVTPSPAALVTPSPATCPPLGVDPPARQSRPVLPRGHADTGVPSSTKAHIESWLLAKIHANAALYAYDALFDGYIQYPPLSPGQYRAPRSPMDFLKLGYFQYQCRALVCAIKRVMPGPEAARLEKNFSNLWVAINDKPNMQGVMRSRENGLSVMLVDIDYPIAKTHNIIAHELAHCALFPFSQAGITTHHNEVHTALWKKFLRIGLDTLGWDFVEFSYPHSCNQYNICDLREFDQQRVYNGTGIKSYGSQLVAWAP